MAERHKLSEIVSVRVEPEIKAGLDDMDRECKLRCLKDLRATMARHIVMSRIHVDSDDYMGALSGSR